MSRNSQSAMLDAFLSAFRHQKEVCEKLLTRLSDDELHRSIAPGINSASAIVNHVAGSMRSRFTDFLTSDGEKAWRGRESEFHADGITRDELTKRWDEAWGVLFDQLERLCDTDLAREVTIRGEMHTVARALCRALDHYGHHTGQLVLITRIIKGVNYEFLTIPPGGSDAFNEKMRERFGEHA